MDSSNHHGTMSDDFNDGQVYTGPTSEEIQSQNASFSSSFTNIQKPLAPSASNELVSNNSSTQHQFKVMLLGDSGVGKTCLLVRFKDGTFLTGSFIATVGIDFRNKIITLGDQKIKLQIFDTAGQERFRSVTHSYYRDAHALLLLYDVTSYSSFENISAWLSEIKEFAHDGVTIMLIGNKIDKAQRVVSREAGERLARDFEVSFLETSAKTGQNVELAFMATAQELLDKELTRKQAIYSTNETSRFSAFSSLNPNRDNHNSIGNGFKTSGWCC